jgi:Rad3-related DNA helicase
MLERPIDEIINEGLEKEVFGTEFKFRKGQRETIEAIVNAYIEDPNSTLVIDAPTGSGKSIIAMWSSWILKEMGKRGYLITSDLSLQDQYESDINRLNLRWPSVKGVDNYTCNVNGLTFSLGECRMKSMGYDQALAKLDCAKTCDYLQLRVRSIDSPVTILNYAFWLLQRNYVAPRMQDQDKSVPFKKRDFVFFDEAHKIDEIVQNHFSPRIDNKTSRIFAEVNKFVHRKSIDAEWVSENRIADIVSRIMLEDDPNLLMKHIGEFRGIAVVYRKVKDAALKQSKRRFYDEIPKDWQQFFSRMDRLKDIWCKFDDYADIIKDNGTDTIVIDRGEDEVKFMCTEESKMIEKYLHEQAGFKVFMSATIGSPREYVRVMGIKSAKFIRLDNAFNYEKSPVVFVNKHRLSYRHKEKSLPHVVKILDKIISKHKGQRGIIHTGSYEFTNYIKSHSKHTFRLMDYENSKEKGEMLELFKRRDDAIFMGPSLLEGLDLKDDISRFQVFFKVPYPNLRSPLIKAKMEKMPGWYDWKTLNNIYQGIGRSVRNENDWAITYILDGSFNNLLKQFENDLRIKKRLKIIK